MTAKALWPSSELARICQKTATWNPVKEKRSEFVYVDVSSVSNERFRIVCPTVTSADDAPSRARKIIRTGDSIFATVRPGLKRVAYVESEYDNQIASTAFCVLRPTPNAVCPRFLFFSLLTDEICRSIVELERGVSYPAVSDSDILKQNIPLPPLPEQKKIATVLAKIWKAVEVQAFIMENLLELKKSLMNSLFTQGLYGEPPKETEVGMMPNSWDVKDVESCLEKFVYERSIQIPTSAYQVEGEHPIVDQGQKPIAGYTNDAERLIIHDLPLIIFGDHTRIIKFIGFPFALGADGTKILKPSAEFDRRYFFYALNRLNIQSRGYNRHFRLLASSIIPVPKMEEQCEIAGILKTIDNKYSMHEAKKSALEDLFKTALNQLMTGKIRVKDLNINTAIVELSA